MARCLSAPDLMDQEGRRCLDSLRNRGRTAVSSLLGRLTTASDAQVQRIREILIYLLDDETLPAYYPGLASNAHPRVMHTVVRVLSAATTYNPAQLVKLLDDPEVAKSALLKVLEARKAYLSAATLLRKAYTLEPNERVAMFRILEHIADESLVPELVNRVSAQDVNTRLGIVRLLSRFDTAETRSALLGRLTDASKDVRLAALTALARMRAPIEIGVLTSLLKDPDVKIQGRAVDILVKRNDPATVPHLLHLLKDESEYVRRAAVEVLNGMEYRDAVEDLLRALKDEDWWGRARAADALAKIGGKRVVEAVVRLIKSEDEYIRRSAIEILNATKDEASMAHLIGALNDSDWWVRERAIDALANIGNKAAVPALLKMMREDRQAAPIVLRAMRVLGDETRVKDILAMLGSRDENTVIEAMATLAELVDTAQVERVAKAIKRRAANADEDVRDAARRALRRMAERLARTRRKGEAKAPAVRRPERERINIRALKSGDRLGERFEFIRRIGKGAFSNVLLVQDLDLHEKVVLKVLHEKMTSDRAMVKRFIREIRYARRINHPHVIRIFDYHRLGNLYAISMEYFPSVTLSHELEPKQPLEFKYALKIAAAVAAGIQAAHDLEIIHRDLKPGNILIDNTGMVKVVDFGIARVQSTTETKLTKTGILIGTPRYMAPEQVTGRKLDGRSDIYSLGVILYEMLTGETAFKGSENVQVLYKHVHGEIKPLHEANPEVPLPLSRIVMRMMSVNPRHRYQTMAEVQEVLESYQL